MVLVLSPILNLAVNVLAYRDMRRSSELGLHSFSVLNLVSEISGAVLGALVALMGLNLIFVFLRRHRHIRRTLLLFGIFSSFYLLLNLYTVLDGIFAFKVQSLPLLLISFGIYLSFNIVFLFWYWYLDYPSQVRRLHHPKDPVQIVFPATTTSPQGSRVPTFLDYLYFTVMVSNTLGPPENHSPSGSAGKVVQVIHSTLMLVLLVIFVSRAINTLV